MRQPSLVILAATALLLSSCKQPPSSSPTAKIKESIPPSPEGGDRVVEENLQLTSSAFVNNSQIPPKYTCDGDDVNPPLNIAGRPEGTQSLALIVDDPDAPAGTWDHWLVWNIDLGTTEIGENSLPAGAAQGVNSFGNSAWGGPCPPPGPAHRYVFKLYALDSRPNLEEGATKVELEQAMEGRILAQTQLVGRYGR